MFEDTLDLAENKLLLLYIFHEVKLPLSKIQATQIVLENNFMNYFTLQQYISELLSSTLLTYMEKEGKNRIIITEKGNKVLTLFKNRVSPVKIDEVNEYLKNNIDNIKKEITITADYTIEKDNNFIVQLKASENDFVIIDLKLSVGSNKHARDLCARWKDQSSDLYAKIIQLLVNS